MSGQIGTVRNIRVNVESVEVELDDDDGIQWTALQTAFPGCSGMYYRDRESPCRSSVKFDGKKFRAPGGAWNDREYFVTLSQRCHSAANMPFGSYENASKQFERSVNAVQQMLASTMKGGSRMRIPSTVLPPSPPAEKCVTATTLSSSPPSSDPIHERIQERESLLRTTGRQLTPLEQQFVDLAKISTGKDAVIEGHRDEIRTLRDRVADLEKQLADMGKKSNDLVLKSTAQEEELRLLRELGTQQTCMKDQVADLTDKLEKRGKEVKELQETLSEKETLWRKETDDLREKFATVGLQFSQKSQEFEELSERFQVSQVSRELLAKELDQLRPLAELIELDEPQNVQKYAETLNKNYELEEGKRAVEAEILEIRNAHQELQGIEETLTSENTRLSKRNTELEERLAHVDEELTKINESWKMRMQVSHQEMNTLKTEADLEIEGLKTSLAEVQKMLEVATRDAAENARRSADFFSSSLI